MNGTQIGASLSEQAPNEKGVAQGARQDRRWVEVAVDAAGPAGGQTLSYGLPAALAGVVPGEAVLVEYGRRQAIGIVLSATDDEPGRETKPILARVRSDGPLLAPLQLRLAAHVSRHYLAPPALVLRQMLPPGFLERVELVARAAKADPGRPAGGAGNQSGRPPDGEGARLLGRIATAGPAGLALDELLGRGSRAALLRELRRLERRALVELEWRVRPSQPSERLERRVLLSDAGLATVQALTRGETVPGRPLGPRQKGLLLDLLDDDDGERNAALSERHGRSALSGLLRRGLIEIETVRRERRPLAGRQAPARGTLPRAASLTAEQQAIVDRVAKPLGERRFAAFLLVGANASGKSAIYAALIRAALEAGRSAMLLVPEIALAVPLLERLQHDLGVEIALLHSALSEGERIDEWRRIRTGEARVVVGTRLAVLAPLGDPGVVIVDEEHDAAYKSDRTPRLHARDVSIELGRLASAPVVLGSATPEVVSVGRARLGLLEHLALPERVAGKRARVEIVDLRRELAEGNRGLLSRRLSDALGRLDRSAGEQAILLINRRGSASIVLCRDCGYVQVCPECRRPLVFHAASYALRCHHCGATAPPARSCPACGSVRIRYLGGGTQRVEREINVRFPEYRVLRLDSDIVARKGAAVRVVDAFAAHEADVLVGTALVAKGLDVPQVTLVGVVSADVSLNLPDDRAAERTYQLLSQAVGRAGRGERAGEALIQTYQPDHPAVRAVAEDDARAFYDDELEARRLFRSPPFGQLIKLTVALEDRGRAEQAASKLAAELRERAASSGGGVEVLGPLPAYIARRAGRWRFHLVLRGESPLDVLGGDPGPPWSVDVDPESLL